ncbi:MAG: sugar isomerase, partial [Candidatus Margulisiibacteriota bacterium]
MNNLEKLFSKTKTFEEYADGYFKYLSELLSKIDKKSIAAFVEELEDSCERQSTVFIIGNGGSAATASHLANDIGLDVLKKSKCDKPFRILALT